MASIREEFEERFSRPMGVAEFHRVLAELSERIASSPLPDDGLDCETAEAHVYYHEQLTFLAQQSQHAHAAAALYLRQQRERS